MKCADIGEQKTLSSCADWCILVDICLCDGCSLCLGYFQTVLPRDRGESLQIWEECKDFCWVCKSGHFCHSIFTNNYTNIYIYIYNFVSVKTPRDEQNILEAASSGASASIGLVANIAANLIAFLAILGFINSALSWFGGMVGYPELKFQVWFTIHWQWVEVELYIGKRLEGHGNALKQTLLTASGSKFKFNKQTESSRCQQAEIKSNKTQHKVWNEWVGEMTLAKKHNSLQEECGRREGAIRVEGRLFALFLQNEPTDQSEPGWRSLSCQVVTLWQKY